MTGQAQIAHSCGLDLLYYNETFWMSDAAPWKREMKDLADQARGDVLVAGYGLGLIHRYLNRNPEVRTVTTVEICGGVIAACMKRYGWVHGRIVIGDFATVPIKGQFDTVIGDTWADATIEYLDLYREFWQRARLIVREGGSILAWRSDVMDKL